MSQALAPKLAHKQSSLECLTPSQAVPKLGTHNLVCRPMHISKWLKRPNLVPGPKPGNDSIFTFRLVYSRLRRTSHEEIICHGRLHPQSDGRRTKLRGQAMH